MNPRFSCGLAVMPLREAPSEAAECGTSLLLGEIYLLINTLENQNGSKWHEIICEHDKYRGFISDAYHVLSLPPLEVAYKVTQGHISTQSPHIYLSPGSLMPASNPHTQPLNPNDFLNQYIGTPYLWGGRSLMGIDCSGLSQVFMDFMKQALPRNASQQYLLGNPIEWGQHQFGDLAFFGAEASVGLPKITHVGIILNTDLIMHASGIVRVDSFTEKGIIREIDGILTHRLMGIKRM